jgi:addiction module HigA family antidote
MAKRKIPPLHPGRILLDEFLEPLGISQYRLAKDIGVPQTRIASIVRGRRRITADTALRLSRYFRMSERFFLNLQTHYDIETEKMKLGLALEREVRPRSDLGAREASA